MIEQLQTHIGEGLTAFVTFSVADHYFAAQALTGQSGHLKDLVQDFLAGVKAA